MARMRRINVVIDAALDDRLEREAAVRGTSKSALVRECVARGLPGEQFDNGLSALAAELVPLLEDVEPVDDVDAYLYAYLYGALGHDA